MKSKGRPLGQLWAIPKLTCTFTAAAVLTSWAGVLWAGVLWAGALWAGVLWAGLDIFNMPIISWAVGLADGSGFRISPAGSVC